VYPTRQEKKGSQPYGDDWKLISKKSWALSDFNFDWYILIPNKRTRRRSIFT
jgi:hypothetical protein